MRSPGPGSGRAEVEHGRKTDRATLGGTTLPLWWGLLPLALFLLLGVGAALVVPSDYGVDPRPTPPDEGAHLGYIDYLLHEHRLPVFLSQDGNYEAHQPPLYYLTCVVPYRLGLVFGGESNPLTRPGIVLVRLWSVLLAGIGVWGAWLLGRRVFGPASLLALAPALFLAAWPGRLLIVSAVTNDGLSEGLCLLAFYLALTVLAEGLAPRRLLLLGTLWALALMTKSTALSLGPVVLLAVLLRAAAEEPAAGEADQARIARRALKALLLTALPVVVLAGWWFVRNQVLYGDPLAARMFAELFSKDRATPDYFFKLGLSGGAYFLLVVVNTALSFWGVFGQANVYHAAGYYYLGLAIWGAALAGLAVQWVRERRPVATPPVAAVPARRGRKRGEVATAAEALPESVSPAAWLRQGWGLSWLLLVTVVAFFLRFNTEFYQAQARYLFTASGPISLLLTLGLWDLQRRRAGVYCVAAGLLAVLAMALWSVLGFGGLVSAHLGPPLFGG